MKKIITAICINALLAMPALAQWNNGMNYRWVRSVKSGGVDRYNAIKMTATQDIYAAGAFSGTAELSNGSGASAFVTSQGGRDGLLTSYDRWGNFQWSVTAGGSQDDEALTMTADSYGYAYVGGYFRGTITIQTSVGGTPVTLTSAGGKDGFVARIHPEGNIMWAYRFGGAGDDEANAMDVADNLRCWVGGTYTGNIQLQGVTNGPWALRGFGGTDAFLARVNDLGGVTWAVEAGGPGDDRATGVTARLDGGTLLGAFERTAKFYNADYELMYTKTAVGGDDGFFYHVVETNGRFSFVTTFGGRNDEQPNDLVEDPNGNGYVAVGSFSGSCTFGNTTLNSAGGKDAFITKFNQNGQVQWAKRMGGFGDDNGQSVSIDHDGNPIVGANYTILAQMPNNQWILSLGWMDGLVMKMSANGNNVLWYTQVVGMRGDDAILGVDTSQAGGVHMAGIYNGSTRFGNLSNPYNVNGNSSDGYFACFTNLNNLRRGPNEVFEAESNVPMAGTLKVAPNPAKAGSTVALMTDGLEGTCTLRAFEMTGRPVMEKSFEASGLVFGQKIETGLPVGIYMLMLQDEQGRTRQGRIVIE